MPQTTVRYEALEYRDLCNRCSRWNENWIRKGMPPESEMPRRMLAEKERLTSEFARRGVQLRLFYGDGLDGC